MRLSIEEIQLLNSHVEAGLISKSKHREKDLWIYKYGPTVQYAKAWDHMTIMCRGLILDADYTIIQRPFKKFFNLEEHVESNTVCGPLPNKPYRIYDKLDGSLGILYWLDEIPCIATCGSFHSDQAEWATKWIQAQDPALFKQFNKDHTYLFEIIYPENRIVVDYKGKKELILLGAIDIESGADIPLEQLTVNLSKVKQIPLDVPVTELKAYGEENSEGFVIRYDSGQRVKIKLDEYLRIHRIIFNTSTLTIWEALMNKQPLNDILEAVPDEFYNWVKNTIANLIVEYSAIYSEAKTTFESLDKSLSRKEIALSIKDYKYKHLIFGLLSNYDISEQVWKLVKPAYSKPFTNYDDTNNNNL